MEIQKFNEMNSYKRHEVILRDDRGRQKVKVLEYPDHDYITICDDNYCVRIPKYLVDSLSKALIEKQQTSITKD